MRMASSLPEDTCALRFDTDLSALGGIQSDTLNGIHADINISDIGLTDLVLLKRPTGIVPDTVQIAVPMMQIRKIRKDIAKNAVLYDFFEKKNQEEKTFSSTNP
jgi:hypothetical protein